MRFRARELWLALAGLVAFQNLLLLPTSQEGQNLLIFTMLLWGGALICIEDQLPTLEPNPGRIGLLLGGVLLVAVVVRSARIVHYDPVIYPLTVVAGLALALLCVPPSQLGRFRDPLLILLLLPLSKLLQVAIPQALLSTSTAAATAVQLQALGFQAAVEGRDLLLPGGNLFVEDGCNGFDLIMQVVAVAVIFLLAFPLRSGPKRLLMLVVAPLIGFATNVMRIALLAVINASDWPHHKALFVFFHETEGSLVFAALSVSLFALLYLRLLEPELDG